MKVNYEQRFAAALARIASYQTPAKLRRICQREYGLEHAETLEMAYENVLAEAKAALRGYRGKKAKSPNAGATPMGEGAPESAHNSSSSFCGTKDGE